MSPDDLERKGTESGKQKALFAWAAMAQRYGFQIASNMEAYCRDGLQAAIEHSTRDPEPQPLLAFLHSIPNGGLRNAKTAALMKAEGVRKGVPDVCFPVPYCIIVGKTSFCKHLLYIEMKTDIGRQSDEQKEFMQHCHDNNYEYKVCRSWREAAGSIEQVIRNKV